MSQKLLVTVVSAKDLESKDSNGLSDPYVILKVGTTKCRTKTVTKTLNPDFGETFVLTVNQFEPVRVEVWDYDQLSQDDFEGGFTLNWWTIDDLMKNGLVNGMVFKLKSGHGMRKNVDVKGELILDLRLANFAKELQERGRLTELFPDTPAIEVCIMTFDCSIARAAADSAMAGELKSGSTPRRRSNSGSGDIARSVSESETMPGTVFLLTHFFYAYAFTTKEPMKLELAYDDIRSITESSYSRSGVVLTTTRGWKFLIDKLQSPESFIQQFKDISAQSLCSAVDELSNAAASGEAPAEGPPVSPRKANAPPQPRPCEPLLPVTVPFKVYVYEHNTTYKAKPGNEPCPVSLFVGSKPNVTFKRVVEEAFLQANLPHGSSHKSRIFTVMPGVRYRKFAEQKLTSKWTIASCMAPANIIWHGAPVIMRFYNKSRKSGIKIPNPAALVASAASATATIGSLNSSI